MRYLAGAMDFIVVGSRIHYADIKFLDFRYGHLADIVLAGLDVVALLITGDVMVQDRVMAHDDLAVLRELHIALNGSCAVLDCISIGVKRIFRAGITAAAVRFIIEYVGEIGFGFRLLRRNERLRTKSYHRCHKASCQCTFFPRSFERHK